MKRGTFSALWLLAFIASCKGDQGTLTFPKNHCATDAECWEQTQCLPELNLCAFEQPEQSYQVVLQVAQTPYDSQGRYTFKSRPVEALDSELVLPDFVEVTGSISVLGEPLFAEVTFLPKAEARGYPVTPLSVRTSDSRTPNLQVQLAPETEFSVHVQPLGGGSARFAPFQTTLRTERSAVSFEPTYPNASRLYAMTLFDGTPSPKGDREPALPDTRRIRVRDRANERVVSPTMEVVPGVAFAMPVLADSDAELVFEIDLARERPWTQRIELPVENLVQGALHMPQVPAKVTFVGTVEDSSDRVLPHADLTFVSSFPVPTLTGALGNRDWCQFPKAEFPAEPSVRCSARLQAVADARGKFQVALLPGNYEIYISPGTEAGLGRRVATLRTERGIETQPGGADQGPWSFQLKGATELTGSIVDLDQERLPDVKVHAVPLGLVGTLGGVAAYNREASWFTDPFGAFAMSIDTGYYDVVATPPKDSGYPVLYFANRQFDADKTAQLDRQGLVLMPPLVQRGTLTQAGVPLAGAEVRAYGIVRDLRGFERAVWLHSATTDEAGQYVLLLPPSLDDAPKNTQVD